MKKFILSIVVSLASVALFAGCSSDGGGTDVNESITQEQTASSDSQDTNEQEEEIKKELVSITLNEVVHSIFYAPQYVTQELGFFEEEGLSVTFDIGNGANNSMTALISGSADIALLGTEAGIYVYNEGMQDYPKAFLQLTQRAGNFLISREAESDFVWEDLKGAELIGGRSGGMPQMILESILEEYQLVPDVDIDLITNLDFTSTAGAFTGDLGDYTIEFEPTATLLEQSGIGYIVASLGEASGSIPYTVYMASDEFMKESPELLQQFTNAIYKGQIWVAEHSAEEIASVIVPQFPDIDLETLATIIERYKEQDTWTQNPLFSEEGFERIQDIMEASGELSQRIAFEELVSLDFAKKAME